MSVFRPWANSASRVAFAGLLLAPVALICLLLVYARTPFAYGTNDPVQQPVQFDHRHHVGDDGIDCRYCHNTVAVSPSAGIPSAELCMGCHNQIWNKSPLLEPVRRSYFGDAPIPWQRVHSLPGFVYFNHSIHVNKGIGCVSCHGRVDQMAAVEQVAGLNMGWCLDCHRNPTPNLRPADQITSMTWQPPADPAERQKLRKELARQYDVRSRTDCTTCHR